MEDSWTEFVCPNITTYTLIYDASLIFVLKPRLTPDYARNLGKWERRAGILVQRANHLLALKSRNDAAHLLVTVDPKSSFLSDACQLHILRVQLLLHDLFECL